MPLFDVSRWRSMNSLTYSGSSTIKLFMLLCYLLDIEKNEALKTMLSYAFLIVLLYKVYAIQLFIFFCFLMGYF